MELMSLLATLTIDASEYDKGIQDAVEKANGIKIETPVIPKPDTDKFSEGVKEAEGIGATFKEIMTGVWDGIKDTIIVSGITGAVLSVIGAMREGISLAAETGDAVAKGAQNYRMSTRAYQELNYTLAKSNLKMSDLKTAMSAVNNLTAGKGTEKQAEFLGKLRLNAQDASFGLETLMKTIANYHGNDKGAIVEAFFGKSEKWQGYFEQSWEDIQKLKKEADEVGFIMSDEDVKNAESYADATEKLSNTLQSIQRSFGEAVLPVLTDAVNMVAKIVAFFGGGGEKSWADQFADGDKEFAEELLTIEGTAAAAETLADKLLAMGDTSKMTAEQYEIWKGTAQALIDMIPSLGDVINTETGQVDGNTESIRANIQAWEDLAKQKALQSLKEKKYKAVADAYEKAEEKAVEANLKAAEAEKKKAEARSTLEKGTADYDMELKKISKIADQEVAQAQAEAQQAAKDAEDAKLKFLEWSAAADSMFDATNSGAESATSAVEAIGEAAEAVARDYDIHFNVTSDKFPSFTGGGGAGAPSLNGYVAYNAKGNWNVPYDNYPALLHRGELVMNKSQARQYRDGNGGNYASVGEMVSASVEKAMSKVYVMLNGDKVGDLTSKRIKNNINASTYNKLRAMGG